MKHTPASPRLAPPHADGGLLRRNLISTLLYLLAGGLGILLTVSSGYASPVWPAAGVAVTLLLKWGWRCWPGIWLGDLLIDNGLNTALDGLLWPAMSAALATLQALLAAWLIRGYLQGRLSSLTADWRLALFLVGAGPLACLLSSGLGALIMHWDGRIEESALGGEWLRWWTGDTLGILLFTPISLLLWPRHHGVLAPASGSARFSLPLMITTALLILGHLGLVQLLELRARNQEHAMMDMISNNGTRLLAETLLPLTGLAHFFSASQEVTREEFRQYTSSFLSHPAILSVDWAPRVEAAQRAAFEAGVRAEGMDAFEITELDQARHLTTAAPRAEYFPTLFSEPFSSNRKILGLDHHFEPQRISAMTLARDSQSPIASGLLPLARTDRQVTLVFMPVWQDRQLAGYVVGTLDLQQLFAPLLLHARQQGLQSRVTDITPGARAVTLIDELPAQIEPEWNHTFRFWGRVWQLDMQPTVPYWQPGASSEERVFLGFSMLTALLAVFATLSSASRHHEVRRQVGERTAQLRSELDARTTAEHALHISEQRYRRLIEWSPFGVLVQCHGRCRFVNASTMRMFGASTADQLLGQELLDFIHPDSQAMVAERLARRTEGQGVPESAVVHYRRLDGSYSWAELTSVAYEYEGQPGLLVLLNDVSDRIRAEEQRDRFFTLSLDLFCIASTEGYFKSVNPAFTQVLGWSEQEWLSRPILDFVHPDDVEATRRELALLAQNDISTLAFENRYLCKQGGWRRLSWKALPQPGGLLFATARDITEQHQTAQRLTELNAELKLRIKERGQALAALHVQKEEVRAVLDHLMECVITIDSRGIIRRVNPAVQPLLGYDPNALLGHNISCLMDSPLQEQHDHYLARYLETGQRHIIGSSREVTGRHKAGHAVSLELSVSEYRINDEPFFIGTLRDIRERKAMIANLTQAREQAEQASRAKSAFLATMSHEIRTPMNGVIGMVDVLARDQLTPYQQDLVKTVRDSATNLLTIIDDILDFSKIEAGKLAIDMIPTEINALLEEQCRALGPMAAAREVDLHLHLGTGPSAWIYSDPVRLRQIIANLVGNAIKFSAREHQTIPRRGAVDIHLSLTESSPPQLVLEVADNGIGIALAQQHNLFMPFTQMESSTTRRFGGTGLGLAICKRLTELMAGQIEVESQPGQGSLFRVTLPARPAAAPGPQTPSVLPLSAADPRAMQEHLILVAEDDAINRKVIQYQLGLLGYRCEAAHNGREALAMWRDKQFNLLLTDLHMPEMDGYELAEHIRREEQGPHRLPILTLTAHAQRGEAARALASGMDEYLTKPITLDALEAVLARWLRGTTRPDTTSAHGTKLQEALLDPQVLVQMLGHDRQLMADTLRDYTDALGSLAVRLEETCLAGDFPAIVALAHRLKSSSRAVGAQRLATLYSGVEDAAKHGDSATVHRAAADLTALRLATLKAAEQQLVHLQRSEHKHEDPDH